MDEVGGWCCRIVGQAGGTYRNRRVAPLCRRIASETLMGSILPTETETTRLGCEGEETESRVEVSDMSRSRRVAEVTHGSLESESRSQRPLYFAKDIATSHEDRRHVKQERDIEVCGGAVLRLSAMDDGTQLRTQQAYGPTAPPLTSGTVQRPASRSYPNYFENREEAREAIDCHRPREPRCPSSWSETELQSGSRTRPVYVAPFLVLTTICSKSKTSLSLLAYALSSLFWFDCVVMV